MIRAAACALWLVGAALAQAAPPPDRGAVERSVGMVGKWHLVHARGDLDAPARDEEDPDIVVWLDDVARDGEVYRYAFGFVGYRPGDYDLRAWTAFADGASGATLPPMPVRIVSVLPEGHDGDLAAIDDLALPRLGGYRTALLALAGLWLALPLWWVARRLRRRRVAPAPPPPGAPTLADQLRPLVRAALAGALTAAERARLERLLLAHWRQRLQLDGIAHLEAVRRMRAHAEAGALLADLERWLHMPPGGPSVDVEKVLRPYASAPAVDEAMAARSPA